MPCQLPKRQKKLKWEYNLARPGIGALNIADCLVQGGWLRGTTPCNDMWLELDTVQTAPRLLFANQGARGRYYPDVHGSLAPGYAGSNNPLIESFSLIYLANAFHQVVSPDQNTGTWIFTLTYLTFVGPISTVVKESAFAATNKYNSIDALTFPGFVQVSPILGNPPLIVGGAIATPLLQCHPCGAEGPG